MIRVRCQQHVSIDVKGRLALPAPIRRALEEAGEVHLVLFWSHQGAVVGYTARDFETEVEDKLRPLDPFSDALNDVAHATLSTAADVEVDGQGRVRVPQHLRELAGLTKDCVVHTVLGHIEIWERQAWDQRFQEAVGRLKHRSATARAGS